MKFSIDWKLLSMLSKAKSMEDVPNPTGLELLPVAQQILELEWEPQYTSKSPIWPVMVLIPKPKKIAKPLGLSVRGMGGEHTPIGKDGTVDISPSARFCISEAEIVTALYKGIRLLKA